MSGVISEVNVAVSEGIVSQLYESQTKKNNAYNFSRVKNKVELVLKHILSPIMVKVYPKKIKRSFYLILYSNDKQ